MPTYLCHGFKWERQALRGWVAVHDVDDAAPDWIIAPASAEAILRTMAEKYSFVPFGAEWRAEEAGHNGEASRRSDGEGPSAKAPLETRAATGQEPSPSILDAPVRLLEEYHYDESVVDVATPPFAYVADYWVEVETGVSIEEEMRKYAEMPKNGEAGWFEKLMVGVRVFGEDTLGLGWYVVVCEDEERNTGWVVEEEEEEEKELEANESKGLGTAEAEKVKDDERRAEGESEEGKGLKSRLKKMVLLRKKE